MAFSKIKKSRFQQHWPSRRNGAMTSYTCAKQNSCLEYMNKINEFQASHDHIKSSSQLIIQIGNSYILLMLGLYCVGHSLDKRINIKSCKSQGVRCNIV